MPPARASALGWPWKGDLSRLLSLPPAGATEPPSRWPRSPASTAAPVPTMPRRQSPVSLSASSSWACSLPKQRLRCRPEPGREQSHIVQSKQLPYQLEQKRNHAPRPQSPDPAGQSRVKRLEAARQRNTPLSVPRACTKGGSYAATPPPPPPCTLLPTSFEKPEHSMSLCADGVCSR